MTNAVATRGKHEQANLQGEMNEMNTSREKDESESRTCNEGQTRRRQSQRVH